MPLWPTECTPGTWSNVSRSSCWLETTSDSSSQLAAAVTVPVYMLKPTSTARGGSTDDTAAREIGTQLSQKPGFQSYTVVRTAEDEVVVMTVFDTREQLEAAVHALAEFVHQRVAPLQAGEPERRAGDVLYQTRA